MYIIMYKYSTFKINRKSFPNNIKNPIAPAQRMQSPPSPSSRPDRGSPKAKPHAAIRQHGVFLLSSSKRSDRLPYKLLFCFIQTVIAILIADLYGVAVAVADPYATEGFFFISTAIISSTESISTPFIKV